MTINDIKKYTDEYVIQNGNVYLKSNNQQVLDEDTIEKNIKVMLNNLVNQMEIFQNMYQK